MQTAFLPEMMLPVSEIGAAYLKSLYGLVGTSRGHQIVTLLKRCLLWQDLVSCVLHQPVVSGFLFLTPCRSIDVQEAPALIWLSVNGTGNDELVKRVAKKSVIMAAKLTWCRF